MADKPKILHLVEEIDQLVRRDLGLDEIAVGFAFDLGASLLVLLEIGGNYYLSSEVRLAGADGAEYVYADNLGHHDIEQDEIVCVGKDGIKAFLPVGDNSNLIAVFFQGTLIEVADKALVFNNQDVPGILG